MGSSCFDERTDTVIPGDDPGDPQTVPKDHMTRPKQRMSVSNLRRTVRADPRIDLNQRMTSPDQPRTHLNERGTNLAQPMTDPKQPETVWKQAYIDLYERGTVSKQPRTTKSLRRVSVLRRGDVAILTKTVSFPNASIGNPDPSHTPAPGRYRSRSACPPDRVCRVPLLRIPHRSGIQERDWRFNECQGFEAKCRCRERVYLCETYFFCPMISERSSH